MSSLAVVGKALGELVGIGGDFDQYNSETNFYLDLLTLYDDNADPRYKQKILK